MTVEVSTPKSFIRYLKRLKNPQKQNAAIEAIAKFMKSPRPETQFRTGRGQAGVLFNPCRLRNAHSVAID